MVSASNEVARLAEPLRSRVRALLAAADGRVTITSGRRSVEEQVQLRRQHCGTTYYAIYQMPSSQCSPPTAKPGASKHQSGLAVDLGGDLALARRLGLRLGLHTPVRGEAWHFEPRSGIRPLDWGDVEDTVGDIGDATGPLGDVLAGGGLPDIGGMVTDAIASVFEALMDPLLSGARRVAITVVLVGGGMALITLGGIRSAGGGVFTGSAETTEKIAKLTGGGS